MREPNRETVRRLQAKITIRTRNNLTAEAETERKLRRLEREIRDFSRQAGNAVRGREISRNGARIPREKVAAELDRWYAEISAARTALPVPRNWRPLGTLTEAKKQLLEWRDGTTLRARFDGGRLPGATQWDPAARTSRTGPLPPHSGTRVEYYDNPLHDK